MRKRREGGGWQRGPGGIVEVACCFRACVCRRSCARFAFVRVHKAKEGGNRT